MLCQFLPYRCMNLLYLYKYPLPLEAPSILPPFKVIIAKLSSQRHAAASRWLFYTWTASVSLLLSQFVPPSPYPLYVSKTVLCVFVPVPVLKTSSTKPFFQIPYIYINNSVGFSLSYFTLYDRSQVHPHDYKGPSFIPFYN